jgi:Undecaprenyl-phosphate glucose phosphotransferase
MVANRSNPEPQNDHPTLVEVHASIGPAQPQTLEAEPAENEKPAKARTVSFSLVASVLFLVEAMLVAGTGVLTKTIYIDWYLQSPQPFFAFALLSLVMTSAWLVAASSLGLYEEQTLRNRTDYFARISVAAAVAFAALAAIVYVLKPAEPHLLEWVALWFVLSFSLICATRAVAGLYVKLAVAEGRNRKRVAIYGADELGARLAQRLTAATPDVDLRGIFDSDRAPQLLPPGCRTGGLQDLLASARRGELDQIIVALDDKRANRLGDVVDQLSVLPLHVHVYADIRQFPVEARGCRLFADHFVLDVQRPPLSDHQQLIKRGMDLILASAGMAVCLPLFALIALAIKFDSRGPVFFRQQRLGYNRQSFRIFKFRTMTTLDDGAVVEQARKDDKRTTRVGAFLRRWSLDELPQLINVLRGEMSLVGPRPHALAHDNHYENLLKEYPLRGRIKPGITGWAQVNGCRGETRDSEQMRRRVEYDVAYIENWELWLDIKILLMTVVVVLTGRNAY